MKRKLKELKENECIKINTLAQAKYFIDKLNFSVMPSVLVGKVIVQSIDVNNKFYWNDDEHTRIALKRIPASDFIKPKKSNMKKELDKLRKTCKQLAETQEKTNQYLEVLNGKNERIENTEHLQDSSKIEHTELMCGKWYKNKKSNNLCFRRGNMDNYGFLFDKWSTNIACVTPTEWIEATPEEVEEALIREAERRGIGYGVTISFYKQKSAFFDEGQFVFIEEDLCWDNSGYAYHIIFQSGKWAEIIETQEIDWSKPGQLMVHEMGGICITDGNHTEDYFCAFNIENQKNSTFKYVKDFPKSLFKPYIGTITLKND